jgi:hypothetical protein
VTPTAQPVWGNWRNGTVPRHDWLEGRGPQLKLIRLIDDATSRSIRTLRASGNPAGSLALDLDSRRVLPADPSNSAKKVHRKGRK